MRSGVWKIDRVNPMLATNIINLNVQCSRLSRASSIAAPKRNPMQIYRVHLFRCSERGEQLIWNMNTEQSSQWMQLTCEHWAIVRLEHRKWQMEAGIERAKRVERIVASSAIKSCMGIAEIDSINYTNVPIAFIHSQCIKWVRVDFSLSAATWFHSRQRDVLKKKTKTLLPSFNVYSYRYITLLLGPRGHNKYVKRSAVIKFIIELWHEAISNSLQVLICHWTRYFVYDFEYVGTQHAWIYWAHAYECESLCLLTSILIYSIYIRCFNWTVATRFPGTQRVASHRNGSNELKFASIK